MNGYDVSVAQFQTMGAIGNASWKSTSAWKTSPPQCHSATTVSSLTSVRGDPISQSGSVDCQFSSVASCSTPKSGVRRASRRRSPRSTHVKELRVRTANAVVQLCARIRSGRIRGHDDIIIALRVPGPLQLGQLQFPVRYETAATYPYEQLNPHRGATHSTSDLVNAGV